MTTNAERTVALPEINSRDPARDVARSAQQPVFHVSFHLPRDYLLWTALTTMTAVDRPHQSGLLSAASQ
jgi:hypothetical protein